MGRLGYPQPRAGQLVLSSPRDAGDLDIRGFFGFNDGVRPGLSAVRVQVGITGPETPGRYQELAAAVDEHCPVLDLFRHPVPVARTITAGLTR